MGRVITFFLDLKKGYPAYLVEVKYWSFETGSMHPKDLNKLRDLIAVEIKSAIKLLSMQQSTTNHKLDLVYERLEKVEEGLKTVEGKQDATLVDIHN